MYRAVYVCVLHSDVYRIMRENTAKIIISIISADRRVTGVCERPYIIVSTHSYALKRVQKQLSSGIYITLERRYRKPRSFKSYV